MTTIEVQGKTYRVMPALVWGQCDGCAFDTSRMTNRNKRYDGLALLCGEAKSIHACHDPERNDSDFVFVLDNKRSLAAYVANRLENP